MPEEEKTADIKDYISKRNPDSKLWDKVQHLSRKEDGKLEAVDIMFEQQYKLPEENIELIKKLAKEEQPKPVRLHIAKNLEKYDNIPFGMYADLFEILSNDTEQEIKQSLKNTSLYHLTESTLAGLRRVQPTILASSLQALSQQQKEIRRTLEPMIKIQTSNMAGQIAQMQKMLGTLHLDKIKIPKVSFNVNDFLLKELRGSTNVGISADVILTKAAENNPQLKEIVESKKEIETASKTLNDVSNQIESLQKTTNRNFRDVGDKQNEYHIEQMAEHQKTRDELLIDNGKLQEKINTLKNIVADGWKKPKNWSVGFIISAVAGLVIWVIQSFFSA